MDRGVLPSVGVAVVGVGDALISGIDGQVPAETDHQKSPTRTMN